MNELKLAQPLKISRSLNPSLIPVQPPQPVININMPTQGVPEGMMYIKDCVPNKDSKSLLATLLLSPFPFGLDKLVVGRWFFCLLTSITFIGGYLLYKYNDGTWKTIGSIMVYAVYLLTIISVICLSYGLLFSNGLLAEQRCNDSVNSIPLKNLLYGEDTKLYSCGGFERIWGFFYLISSIITLCFVGYMIYQDIFEDDDNLEELISSD